MSLNKFIPHVYVIPEDRADEQIANGFVNHDRVLQGQIRVLPCVTGWRSVRDKFQTEYIPYLRIYKDGRVIMLIDYDGHYAPRRADFEQAIPDDIKARVFVIGVRQDPEDLKKGLGKHYEQIGQLLADECYRGAEALWNQDQLRHNDPDRKRLVLDVRKILFGSS